MQSNDLYTGAEIFIGTKEEYTFCVNRGYEPLIDARFKMDMRLRLQIQRKLFGTGHTPAENQRFYVWCWNHYPHRCEETLQPLNTFSAVYVSHILSRGAYPEMAHDPRNVNILCFEKHNEWENGRREKMRIYAKNKKRIELLKHEYENIQRTKQSQYTT